MELIFTAIPSGNGYKVAENKEWTLVAAATAAANDPIL